jgi:hypothetical protein
MPGDLPLPTGPPRGKSSCYSSRQRAFSLPEEPLLSFVRVGDLFPTDFLELLRLDFLLGFQRLDCGHSAGGAFLGDEFLETLFAVTFVLLERIGATVPTDTLDQNGPFHEISSTIQQRPSRKIRRAA